MHDIIPYKVKAGDEPHEINANLRRGNTIKGRLVGPDGQTVDKALIIATLHFHYTHLNGAPTRCMPAKARSSCTGSIPRNPRASFLDADHQWGTTVELYGNQSDEEVTVQLQPCGQAKARFVGLDDKAVAMFAPAVEILGSPGPPSETRNPQEKAMLAADALRLLDVDRIHYWEASLTDADGRITFPALIPGASYRISDRSTANDENIGVQVRKDFTVKPGETLELGDILIDKPAQ